MRRAALVVAVAIVVAAGVGGWWLITHRGSPSAPTVGGGMETRAPAQGRIAVADLGKVRPSQFHLQAMKDAFGKADPLGKVALADPGADDPDGTNLTGKLWFEVDLDGGQRHAVFPALETKSAPHAQGAQIGALMYRKQGDQWALEYANKSLGEAGGFGSVPAVSEVQVVSLGPNWSAVLVQSGSTNQGYTESGVNIYAYDPKEWRDLGFVATYEDNAGTCDDESQTDAPDQACYEIRGQVTAVPGTDPEFADLRVVRTKTVKGKAEPYDDLTYRLVKGRYAATK